MGRKEEACAECTQKCLQIHGENKNSSAVTSFFKVMIGDQFTKVLYLPPKFAATMSKSINQITFLEDSRGRQWEVTIASVNGTLAFEKGWSTFSSDHHLRIGDFLVFSYIIGSHFVVKIFDKSACEKVVPLRNSSSIKRKWNGRFADEVKLCDEQDNGSMNRPGCSSGTGSGSDLEKSPCFHEKDEHNMNRSAKKPIRSEKNKGLKPVCTDGLEEELCYVIDRSIGYEREGEKCPTVNLFDLEMEKNGSRTIGIVGSVLEESLHHQSDGPLRTQMDENTASIRSGSGSQSIAENESEKWPMEPNIAAEDIDIKVSICDKDLSEKCRRVSEVMKFQIDGSNGNLVPKPSGNIPLTVYQKEHSSFINSCQTVKHNILPEINLFHPPKPIQAQNCQYGEMGKIIKTEPVETTPTTPVEVGKTIKEELEEMIPSFFDDEENLNTMVNCSNPFTIEKGDNRSGAEVSCVVAENRSFLELPISLPGWRPKLERKVVFLRDPMKRMWPVLYHATANVNVLTSGWAAFCQANGIQARQECVFQVENETEGIYEVSIRMNS